MSDQPPMNDPKSIWRNLETKGEKLSSTEVRAKAEKLAAEIRRDTIVGLVFTSLLTLIGLIGLAVLPQAGPAERIIGTIAVAILWLGAYRTSTRPRLPSAAQFATCVAFYRRELERRRNYFANSAKAWLFGIIILIALVQFLIVMRGFNPSARDLLSYPAALLLLVLVVVPLWRRQVRRFQRELDALDAFERAQ
jgi:hypothetical protein